MTDINTANTVFNHGLDTVEAVYFYEPEFYALSNFSAFKVLHRCAFDDALVWFDTAEAAYHFEKFPNAPDIQKLIKDAISAHETLQIAKRNKAFVRSGWDSLKIEIMRRILIEKAFQHEYVTTLLLRTGNRKIVENSWRDNFWGWGDDTKGQNVLGELWMEIRKRQSWRQSR